MSKLYDVATEAMLDSLSFPQTVMMYGPLRSRRGRLLNRVRRILGLDELQELYAQWPAKVKVQLADEMTVRWDTRGTLTVDE